VAVYSVVKKDTAKTDSPSRKSDKRATFMGSIGLFLIALFAYLTVRWIGYEPFVIPSGSMIPTLLVNDHILVEKFAFGLRVPFTKIWLRKPALPKRGDVVVFSSVDDDSYYLIKRVVGLPGDHVQYDQDGTLKVNGEKVPTNEMALSGEWTNVELGQAPKTFHAYTETLGQRAHVEVLEQPGFHYAMTDHVVALDHIFMMGDNRDHSRDSRYWGDLPVENLLGRATWVWLSCKATVAEADFLCDPRQIRWQHAVHRIQ
jgi:signal peptidase I